MIIAGRTFKEYLRASRWFLAAIALLSVISVVGRLTNRFAVAAEYLQVLVLLLTGWAGWRAAQKRGFDLIQTAVVGFVLSFATHWTLPLFHSAAGITLLFVVNSIVFMAVALCGGFLAMKTRIS